MTFPKAFPVANQLVIFEPQRQVLIKNEQAYDRLEKAAQLPGVLWIGFGSLIVSFKCSRLPNRPHSNPPSMRQRFRKTDHDRNSVRTSRSVFADWEL